jgi:hypothetical protein
MTQLTFKPTTEKIISENYPYGFRERTTKTDYLEFNFKKGFRHCSYTINPKTGKQNAVKKGIYYDLMLLTTDENGHCKSFALSLNGSEELQRVFDFMSKEENFKLFTAEQIEYLYMSILMYSKVNAKAQVIYCGTDWEQLKPLYEKPINEIIEAIKTKGTENRFNRFVFDWVAINNLKVEGYNPFVVKSYTIG